MSRWFVMLVLLWVLATTIIAAAVAATTVAKPRCTDVCGGITVPYPFGIGDKNCSLAKGFNLTCQKNSSELLLFNSRVENISLHNGQLTVVLPINSICSSEIGNSTRTLELGINLEETPFTFSNTRNRLTATGCDTIAFIGENQDTMTNGCVSFCKDEKNSIGGSCDGIGCCQTSIQKGLKRLRVNIGSIESIFFDYNTTTPSNSCRSAFLVDKDWFNFSESNLSDTTDRTKTAPAVLDWAIGNLTCAEANGTSQNLCGENTICSDSTNGVGYLCLCKPGYSGNPYLPTGCQVIDKCAEGNPCGAMACFNTRGGYPPGSARLFDVWTDGYFCVKIIDPKPRFTVSIIILGVGLSVLVIFLVGGCYLLTRYLKRRKLAQRKQKFFQKNGGLLLQEKIYSNTAGVLKSKIFTEEELDKATDSYNESRILGKGGAGTVYKGMLQDGGIVAIKKSKTMEEYQIDQFVNEVTLLSQFVHKHVVRLLGCCLESEVPLLVYEFVSKGTLFDHIHSFMSSLSWEDRLRIATEVASAIAFLHSYASIPILHRDIKTGNILLDENYRAKLADFGISRSISEDKTHLTTSLQGTPGYMDPEIFETGQYTEKSDVYSFGVVLVEILMGQKPISSIRCDGERNLRQYFLSLMNENRLFEVLEDRVVSEATNEELLQVAELAKRCLELKGSIRPTMNEVAALLDNLTRSHGSSSQTMGDQPLLKKNSFVAAYNAKLGSFGVSESMSSPFISTL